MIKKMLITVHRSLYSISTLLHVRKAYEALIESIFTLSDLIGFSFKFPISIASSNAQDEYVKLSLRSFAISNIFLDPESNNTSELAYFAKIARGKETFFDVGAYLGIYSMVFCATKKSQEKNQERGQGSSDSSYRVVSFDPSSNSKKLFSKNVQINGFSQVQYCNYAIGGSRKKLSMYDDTNFFTLFPTKGAAKKSVIQSTIDYEVKSRKIVPDLVKIDIEGLEYEALLGARNLIAAHKPALIIEIHPILLSARGVNVEDIFAFLKKHKYSIRDFYTNKKQTSANASQMSKTAFVIFCE